MIIIDDKVIFELSDIRQFSPGVQRALTESAAQFNTAADFLSQAVGDTIRGARDKLTALEAQGMRPIAEELARQAVPREQLDLARDRLNDARIALGIPS